MNYEDSTTLLSLFNTPPGQITKKIKKKRQVFLLKQQLFMTIYQKKGQENFDQIIRDITLAEFPFGFNIITEESERVFNYIIKGAVMVFVSKPEQPGSAPVLHQKMGPSQYFGDKTVYNTLRLHSAKSVGRTLVLQLPLQTFYKTFSGHFIHKELKQKVDFLNSIWVFKDISRHQTERILLTSKTVKYTRNNIVFREGDHPQNFYIILEGQLTLFHTKSELNSRKKHEPFIILSKKQVCGIDQLMEDEPYRYGVVCTASQTKLLVITKNLFSEVFQERINNQNFIGLVRKVQNQLHQKKQFSQVNKSLQKLNQLTPPPKKVSTSLKKRQSLQYIKNIQTQPSENNPHVFDINKANLTKQAALRHKSTRELILMKKKKQQKVIHSSQRISAYTNNSFTYDKELLLSYLVRKQKKQKLAERKQLNFRNTIINVVKEMSVEKSSAIRNQKRKMKKSRKNVTSVPNL